MFDEWEITINKFGTIKLSNEKGYRIHYLLNKPPESMDIYRGYKVYKPFESFDGFRSYTLFHAFMFVEYSKEKHL